MIIYDVAMVLSILFITKIIYLLYPWKHLTEKNHVILL